VIIGASSGLFTNPGASLIVGAFGGVVSSLSFSYLHDILKDKIGLHDTAGVHNLHGLPGILGGLISAIAIAVYTSDPLSNSEQTSYLSFYSNPFNNRTFGEQGAIQVAGTAVSLGMGLAFGIGAGLIISLFYTTYLPHEFYNDHYHF
jgi:ammonium transporter Rh